MKIGTRLTLRFVAVVAITFCLIIGSIYFYFKRTTEQEFYQILNERQGYLQLEYFQQLQLAYSSDSISVHPNRLAEEGFALIGTGDKIVFQSGVPFSQSQLRTLNGMQLRSPELILHSGDRMGLMMQIQINGKTLRAILFARDVDGQNRLRDLEIRLLFIFILAIGVLFLLGSWFSRVALRPMIDVIDEVDAIRPSNIQQRVTVSDGKDEISRLAMTFNRMLDRIEEGFVMQRSFLNTASHELKTPLTAIIGKLELALVKAEKSDKNTLLLEEVLHDSLQMSDLISALLYFVREEKNEALLEEIRMDELIFQLEEGVRNEKYNRELKIHFKSFPENPEDFCIFGHKSLMLSALRNLVDNGFKYSGNQPVDLYVDITSDFLTIEVEDKGNGISQEDQQRIFEVFYRSENTSSVAGHGLGLNLSDKIIRMHNGRLSLGKTGPEGSVFRVEIPLSKSVS